MYIIVKLFQVQLNWSSNVEKCLGAINPWMSAVSNQVVKSETVKTSDTIWSERSQLKIIDCGYFSIIFFHTLLWNSYLKFKAQWMWQDGNRQEAVGKENCTC